MAIEIVDGAGLTEVLDPERTHAMAVHGAEPGERRRMTVEHRHDPAVGWHVGEEFLDVRARMHQAALARPLRRGPAGIEPVGRGDGEQAHVAAVLRHQPDRLDRLRCDRAGIGHDDLAVGAGLAQPIGAVDDRLGELGRHRARDLLDRAGRQPQIDRAAGLVAQPVALRRLAGAVALDVVEREGEDRRELIDEGGLERGEPVLRHADERRRDRLVCAALGCERDAGWRRHQDEASLLVTGVIEGIEPALDERIIERADRNQPLAVDDVREAERGEQDEQVHLGDAELDMLALGRELPFLHRGDALVLEGVGHRGPREQAAPVDPGAEIGRDGDVGRGGDDAIGERALGTTEIVEQRAEAGLRRDRGLCRHGQLRRHGDARGGEAALARCEGHAGEEGFERGGRDVQTFEFVQPFELVPFVAGPDMHRGAESLHLRRRHQAGMVVLVAGERQTEALDGIGDEADRPVVRHAAEGFQQSRQVVAGEIGHQPRQLLVRARRDQPRHVTRRIVVAADLVVEALAPGRAALEHQRGVELVRAVVDPLPQPLAAGLAERRVEQRSIFEDHDLPAERLEQRFVARP